MQDPRDRFDPYGGEGFSPDLFSQQTEDIPQEEPGAAQTAQNPYDGEEFAPPVFDTEQEETQPQQEQEPAQPQHKPAVHRTRGARRNEGFLLIVLLIVVVLAVVLALPNMLFRLRTVNVVFSGTHTYTEQDVITASGLYRDQNLSRVDTQQIQDNINREIELICSNVSIVWPDTVTIDVRQRVTVAAYRRLGMAYLLDEDGIVMKECNLDEVPDQLPIIVGFDVVSANVGQKLAVRTASQMEAYCAIVKEIEPTDGILQINLKTPSEIYMETESGITLRMGNAEYMHAKMAAYRVDLSLLRQLNTTGILDLSVPEDAKFKQDH